MHYVLNLWRDIWLRLVALAITCLVTCGASDSSHLVAPGSTYDSVADFGCDMSGKINLTVGEMQGCLRQIMEGGHALSAEQRYALMGAIETMEFLKRLSPGLKTAVEKHRNASNPGPTKPPTP